MKNKLYQDLVVEPKERRRLLAVFLAATFALMVVALVLFSQYQKLILKPAGVRDAYDVLLQTHQIFSHLQDLETGQRGYLLTGDEVFLEPYQRAGEHIDQQLGGLRDKIKDNPQRLKQLNELS